jgi:rod shape-determining protein MreD
MGSAFLFGLLLDVHQGSMLGQHALAYTAMGFLAIGLQRRLPWFTVPSQALQILPLFLLAHTVELSVRMAAGGTFPGLPILLAPLLEALLWPLVSVLLLLPQRRAPDPDAHRPL